ncbi:SH3 domain-containing protein [Pyxidicoccus parkwayensis]|uniref:SH3 domain-containing protein n=1 Tax=Pyxidicoccus parkwayensis TaxID=2813578 RepID=A0ABX7NP83_9BACT|nr:SH3 domain-containing protein [Pyxidicoccus parkwaysis]QSQ20669.1 SH3 domain-containing protein [Pyxidicoccus parkwaysis]
MSMRARAALTTAVLALALPGVAAAVKVNDPLYVKAKNTRVQQAPSPTVDTVVILQPGEQVTWKGADPKNKQWHQVETTGGKKGFVFQSNLSTTPPNMELVTDHGEKRKVDPKGFVASAAAVKALSPGAVKYGENKGGDSKKAVEQIQALEALAKKVTTEEIASHAREAGLFEVVGPDAVAKAQAPAKATTGKKKKGAQP